MDGMKTIAKKITIDVPREVLTGPEDTMIPVLTNLFRFNVLNLFTERNTVIKDIKCLHGLLNKRTDRNEVR